MSQNHFGPYQQPLAQLLDVVLIISLWIKDTDWYIPHIKICSQISLEDEYCPLYSLLHVSSSSKILIKSTGLKHLISLIQLCCFYSLWRACCTCIRLSTLSWRAVGGLFLGRIACTKTPSTNSWDATRTWKRWPQFFTHVSRTWGDTQHESKCDSVFAVCTRWKTLPWQQERGNSERLQIAGNERMKMDAAHSPPTYSQ